MIAAIQSTRQFARRQRTWFRSVAGAEWVTLASNDTPETIAENLT